MKLYEVAGTDVRESTEAQYLDIEVGDNVVFHYSKQTPRMPGVVVGHNDKGGLDIQIENGRVFSLGPNHEVDYAETLGEGVLDNIRAKNYDRLAKRSHQKAVDTYTNDVTTKNFADPDRFDSEDTFMKHMGQSRNREVRATELRGGYPAMKDFAQKYGIKDQNTYKALADYARTHWDGEFENYVTDNYMTSADGEFDEKYLDNRMWLGGMIEQFWNDHNKMS